MRLLIIDDDKDLLKLLDKSLRSEYEVTLVSDVETIDVNNLAIYDLILLDVMMPKMSGFDFLCTNRQYIDAPVLFLTAKDFEADKLEGFASGGDDYITKPFSVRELRARIDAHLRREKREKGVRLIDGVISCNIMEKIMYVEDKIVSLTASEYEICELLLKHKNQTFTKEDIYTSVYGYDASGDSRSSITERIKNIRNKFREFGVNPIKTIWGVGYRWEIENL